MSILDRLAAVLGMPNVFLGTQPHAPDSCISLREYPGAVEHYFGGADEVHRVQARIRDVTAATAFAQAEAVAAILGRHVDADISCIRSTPILDIGMDDANPPRYEYTVNFTVRRFR